MNRLSYFAFWSNLWLTYSNPFCQWKIISSMIKCSVVPDKFQGSQLFWVMYHKRGKRRLIDVETGRGTTDTNFSSNDNSPLRKAITRFYFTFPHGSQAIHRNITPSETTISRPLVVAVSRPPIELVFSLVMRHRCRDENWESSFLLSSLHCLHTYSFLHATTVMTRAKGPCIYNFCGAF